MYPMLQLTGPLLEFNKIIQKILNKDKIQSYLGKTSTRIKF